MRYGRCLRAKERQNELRERGRGREREREKHKRVKNTHRELKGWEEKTRRGIETMTRGFWDLVKASSFFINPKSFLPESCQTLSSVAIGGSTILIKIEPSCVSG